MITIALIFLGCALVYEIVTMYLAQKRFNQRIDRITLSLDKSHKDLEEILDSLKDLSNKVAETEIEVKNIL